MTTRRIRATAGIAAIAACLPYAALKVAWLAGGSVGTATASGAASIHDGRHTAGNAATLAMELVAALLALALTHRRGERLPPAVVLLPVWVGSGLLAPIAVALPVGLVVQAAVGGSPAPAHNGLDGWVYAVVYGGFVAQALALATAFVLYVRARWTDPPAAGARTPRLPADAGTAAVVAYAVANLAWAAGGGGAPDLHTAAQRSLLVGTGVLALAGAAAVARLVHRPAPHSWPPLAAAWVGTATCVASGVAEYALAPTPPGPATTALLALGTCGGLSAAAAVLSSVAPAMRSGRSPAAASPRRAAIRLP